MNAVNRSRKSIVTITALSLIIGVLTVAPRKAEAVVGGTGETNNKFTWIVDLNGVGGGLQCHGVLIAPTWVLTAAHCIGPLLNGGRVSYTRTNPVTGLTTSNYQDTGQNSTFKNPDYRGGFPDDDIALIKLPKAFPADPLLQVAELPTVGTTVGQKGTIASFSHTTTLPPGQLAIWRGAITIASSKTFIGLSPTASLCSGDSGSGFVTLKQGLNVVTGIVSESSVTDCTTPNHEFAAVDVYQHTGWIFSVAGILSRNIYGSSAVNADYDGDGKLDIAVKTSLGEWKIDFAANGYGFFDVIFAGYGGNEAYPVPADYDGDGKADIAVRTDTALWCIDFAANGFGSWDKAYLGYGGIESLPVPADYDGDGKADLSVKTTGGVWYIDYAKDGFGVWNASYGGYGDAYSSPVPRDYDGDHKADLSVKTSGGIWYLDYAYVPLTFSSTPSTLTFRSTTPTSGFGSWNASYAGYGGTDYHPVPADYDGDGKADLSVKTNGGRWYIDYSSNGFGAFDVSYTGWGDSFHQAVPGDYDGDHKADLAVYDRLNEIWSIDLANDGFGNLNVIVKEMP